MSGINTTPNPVPNLGVGQANVGGPLQAQQPVADGVGGVPPRLTPEDVLAQAEQRIPNLSFNELDSGSPKVNIDDLLAMRAHLPAPGEDKTIIAFKTPYGLRTAIMPTNGVPGDNKAGYIMEQVTAGENLFNNIMAGNAPQNPDKTDVAKLMWFLQANASVKASESCGEAAPMMYHEGAMSIEDPDRHLEEFLTNTNSYERSSSHLSEFQREPGGQPRGVDVRNVPTPNERRTVLFARMPAANETTGPNMGENRMLFVKMEEHGCRGPSFQGTGRAGAGPASTGKSLKRFVANVADFLGHGGGLFKSIFRRIQPKINNIAGNFGFTPFTISTTNNRERIPNDVKNEYKDIVAECSNLKPILTNIVLSEDQQTMLADKAAEMENILSRNNPLSSTGGIRVMLSNLTDAKASYEELPAELREGRGSPMVSQQLDRAIDRIHSQRDHPELRIGNEVIMTRTDEGLGIPHPVGNPSANASINETGSIRGRDLKLWQSSLHYSLAKTGTFDMDGPKAAECRSQFSKDMRRTNFNLIDQNGNATGYGMETVHQDLADHGINALEALADGDNTIALGLMAIANQGIVAPVFSSMITTTMGLNNMFMAKGDVGEETYTIQRLPDEGENKKFSIEYTWDGTATNSDGQAAMFPMGAYIARNSELSIAIHLEVTCLPNGEMLPSFPTEPRYHFSFEPANQ